MTTQAILIRDANNQTITVGTALTLTEIESLNLATTADIQALQEKLPAAGLSQPLTDTQLRANAVSVTGNVNTGLSQPLTDTQLRANAVSVTGNVNTGLSQPLTDTQLRANAIDVQTPMPSSLVVGQGKIAVTNVAQPLPSAVLKNGIVITARDENASSIWVGGNTVTLTDDGTGTGYRLTPGQSISFASSNANAIFVIGASGQIFYYAGN
jgi:hypothetical protein